MNTDLIFQQQAEVFKTLSDSTRLHILYLLLFNEKPPFVQEIAEKTNISHSAASHQLSKLAMVGLVKTRRNGKNIYYVLNDTPQVEEIKQIISFKLNPNSQYKAQVNSNKIFIGFSLLFFIASVVLTVIILTQ